MTNDIIYDMPNNNLVKSSHTLAIIVDNEFGVLGRIVGLFSGRGYNIESLTVSEIDKDKNLSRITIITNGTEKIVKQIKSLLERMIPVHIVHDLTVEGLHVERELALVKLSAIGNNRVEALRIADIFRARVVDATIESFIFEITGKSSKVNSFIELMKPLGMIELARTGVSAMMRGKDGV